ncbi:MAG TPA: hypothetical protein VFJ94_02710, partial [Intrasporangium sp.]|uniref:hypothetical protein n=1 Tax=Intrasporangium sp. TaxID=1925024 RepID=UPI002D791143
MSPLPTPVDEPATGAAALHAELALIERAERLKARLDAATLPALARMLATAQAELAAMRRDGSRAT